MNKVVSHPRFRDHEAERDIRQSVENVSQIDASLDLNRELGTEFIVHFQEVKIEQRT